LSAAAGVILKSVVLIPVADPLFRYAALQRPGIYAASGHSCPLPLTRAGKEGVVEIESHWTAKQTREPGNLSHRSATRPSLRASPFASRQEPEGVKPLFAFKPLPANGGLFVSDRDAAMIYTASHDAGKN
jgi:hypothetical protein